MSGSPHARIQKAQQLQNAGRFAEAASCYAQLLAEWPDLPTCWYNLGFVRRMCGQFEEALAAYDEALKRGVSQPEEVRVNRAVIYADHLRDNATAERELNAALMLNPRYVPALLNLANLREDEGRRSEAGQLYEAVLRLDPDNHLALARLAGLTTATSSDDPLVLRLKAASARPSTPAADRADLGFALGRLLDSCADYDAAFAAYAAANQASRQSAGRATLYDRRAEELLVDRLIAAFPAPSTPTSPDKSAPIFICGMFRSGSTLIEQVLGAHPRVTTGGELELLPDLIKTFLPDYPVSPSDPAALARFYRERLATLFPGAERVTDKRPDNYLHIGLIKQMFPGARIIQTRRDALDNCLSVYFLHLDHGRAYALDLDDIAHHYRQYRRLMDHWQAGTDIFNLDYDAFVREPRPILEKLLAFCGLDWDENCLAFHRSQASVKTASVWQVREPLHTRSSGRWRNYERHIGALKRGLAGFI